MDDEKYSLSPGMFDQFVGSFVQLSELIDESGSDPMKEHLQHAEVWLSGYIKEGGLKNKVQQHGGGPMAGGLQRFMDRRRAKGEGTEW